MDYPVLIKELRERLMLTQEELAEVLHISFASVNRYENGRSNPTMKVRRELKKLMKQAGMLEE